MIAGMGETEPPRPQRFAVKPSLIFDPDGQGEAEPQTIYEMKTPTAREVADLLAIEQDLVFVRDSCALLLDLPVHDAYVRGVLVRALWSSALVAYVRCFATGNRLGLKEADVEAISPEAVAFHRAMKEVRRKHIAHSVNPMEVIKIGVMIGDHEERYNGLAVTGVAHWEPDPESAVDMCRLADALIGVVRARAEQQTTPLVEEAKNTDMTTIKRWRKMVVERGPIDPATVRG
jgi:hypothetical protein